jgi:acyl carrier protein
MKLDTPTLIEKIEEEFSDLPKGLLTEGSVLKETINWSSINSIVLATMIEFEYNAVLTGDELNKLSTIHDLMLLIQSKSNG